MSGIKYKISAIVLVLGILSITTGISYSIFSTKQVSEKTEVIRAGAVTLKLTEEKNLVLDDMYSLSDDEGLSQSAYYEYSVTNTGDCDSNLVFYLMDDESDLGNALNIDKRYIRTSLEINGEVKPLRNVFTGFNGAFGEDTILKGETRNYKLRIWLDFTGLNDEMIRKLQGQNLSFKVKVIAEQKID